MKKIVVKFHDLDTSSHFRERVYTPKSEVQGALDSNDFKYFTFLNKKQLYKTSSF
jgi:hypothetical protein